jgi:hypothetical protein
MRISIDGVPHDVPADRTLAAILIASGRVSWRTTRSGVRPRGVFCGIGVCFDCLVVVNDVPDVRACGRFPAAGDVVRTQHGAELPG